jgi:hypothetical protein
MRNFGTLERWNAGTLERWNAGTLERWNLGAMKLWSSQPRNKNDEPAHLSAPSSTTPFCKKNESGVQQAT